MRRNVTAGNISIEGSQDTDCSPPMHEISSVTHLAGLAAPSRWIGRLGRRRRVEAMKESYGVCLIEAGIGPWNTALLHPSLTRPPYRNTEGTLNFQPRIYKFGIELTLKPGATVAQPSPPNLQLRYLDTVLLTGPDGTPATGLDADATGSITYPGFPILPVATYQGDGFGGPGPGGKRISIDAEGLVLNKDGSFWVSDEYGPYVYKFSSKGRMLQAIMPPPAYIPHRNGSISFSANSPPHYDPGRTVIPADTETGRDNNQGFEGLTITPDGQYLYTMLQSALDQEGGPSSKTRRPARLLKYDISHGTPKYVEEYVVTLPITSANKVAGQSEIHYLDHKQFFILSRDSGAGHGQASSLSLYRHVDIFDISSSTGATDIKSAVNDATAGSIASKAGVLNAGITPALYCPFLDFNLNSELGKFGLHNGGAQDAGLLNEKWESLALAPVDGKDGEDGEWFLFSLSDNDFVTQQGMNSWSPTGIEQAG